MINLLPPKEKKKLLLEKKRKIITIFWFLILFLIFCLTLLLFLSKTYLQKQIKSDSLVLTTAKQGTKQLAIGDVRKRVKSANLNFKKLNSFYSQKIYFSDILESISKIIPQEIFLTGISIRPSVDKKKKLIINISLSGFSPNREILFNFRKNLQNDGHFRGVYFSPSNWVKAKNINFFITFNFFNDSS